MLDFHKQTKKYSWDGHEVSTKVAELIKIYMNFEVPFSIKDGEIIITKHFDSNKELLGWNFDDSADDAISV